CARVGRYTYSYVADYW
nr:immunoglobulin heavy chain junction region [Macaca mulatta]MOV39113.1 immunoglobulin heavy chain junction region [Macaca mulatta]MOV39885.1 immunoglobulin heavy chain junction region [Macaca mulatta]MOV40264.1 immunoglobulin heavy chain junction region [Macaca mulatta]MOV42872.1 immunoglobulin heavy chain junction region [Macaca mulatta]